MVIKIILSLVVVFRAVFAGTIELKGNDTLAYQELVAETADSVTVRTNDSALIIAKSDITSVDGEPYTGQNLLDSVAAPACPETADRRNRLTIINGTGQFALVKIKSRATGAVVESCGIRSNDSIMVHFPNGSFVDYVRHGKIPGKYTYSKGQGFDVCPGDNAYAVMRLTLHGVVYGRYRTEGCSAKEFGE